MRRANQLRLWLRDNDVSRSEFARRIDVTSSYITQLCRDTPPWPGREIARRIAVATGGAVRPDHWAGLTEEAEAPGDQLRAV